MWPLLLLSLVSVMLSLERAVFWLGTHRSGRRVWVEKIAERLRLKDAEGVRAMLKTDRTIYAEIAASLLAGRTTDSTAVVLVETHRHTFERWSTALSTIITAAPLLGILGTVLGIIQSFDLMGRSGPVVDIDGVAAGIAEALITTAFGLIVALVTLFPYMVFRAQAERCIGSIERLVAAAVEGPSRPSAEQGGQPVVAISR